jgi:8-oxo-dGTP diphosphatase
VEEGESPEAGAVRELAEETGLVVAASALRLVSTASTHGPQGRSDATNFRVDLSSSADVSLAVDDPDGLVHEARWFPLAVAVAELVRLPYRPLREPAVAHLTGEAATGTHWQFASPEADPVRFPDPLA